MHLGVAAALIRFILLGVCTCIAPLEGKLAFVLRFAMSRSITFSCAYASTMLPTLSELCWLLHRCANFRSQCCYIIGRLELLLASLFWNVSTSNPENLRLASSS